mmetsp:Transcript_35016/g.75619  ORF Transcript_35016/g.75619 Transcript_35016/m.75619 type:complete len:235 (-) Transcript_35016:674-1378(-)
MFGIPAAAHRNFRSIRYCPSPRSRLSNNYEFALRTYMSSNVQDSIHRVHRALSNFLAQPRSRQGNEAPIHLGFPRERNCKSFHLAMCHKTHACREDSIGPNRRVDVSMCRLARRIHLEIVAFGIPYNIHFLVCMGLLPDYQTHTVPSHRVSRHKTRRRPRPKTQSSRGHLHPLQPAAGAPCSPSHHIDGLQCRWYCIATHSHFDQYLPPRRGGLNTLAPSSARRTHPERSRRRL